MGSFTSKTQYVAEHPTALAMYCSDGRFTEPVEELLRALGHPRLDTLTLPGGPGLLNSLTTPFADLSVTKRAATFLIKAHAISEVYLIAHHSCGYYRHRMAGKPPAEILAAQVRDLHVAARLFEKDHPGLVAHPYYATVIDDRVQFDPMPVPAVKR